MLARLGGGPLSRYDMCEAPEELESGGFAADLREMRAAAFRRRQAECAVRADRAAIGCIRARRFCCCTFAGLVMAFAVTGFAARFYHARRRELARIVVRTRQRRACRPGKSAPPLSDLQTALIYARQRTVPEAAAAATRSIWRKPCWPPSPMRRTLICWICGSARRDSAKLNLELARLAARHGR